MANRPEPEIDISVALVRNLLTEQAPEFADRDIRQFARGWDNTNFRLGNDLIVRVPHRQVAAPLILNEQRWLPRLAGRIDLPLPAPVYAGTPTNFFPWAWSITPWFEGTEAAGAELSDPARTAETLGRFFAQLHTEAPAEAPQNPYRGVPLAERIEPFERALNELHGEFDKDVLRSNLAVAAEADAATERCWLHGDLHGRNMVVHNGDLASVIDWGDMCAGDRATDLAGAFMLVPDHLDIVQQHARASDLDWVRARGWALHFALIYVTHSDDEPIMASIGTKLLQTLTETA